MTDKEIGEIILRRGSGRMKKCLSAVLAGVVLCTSMILPSAAVSVSAEAVDPWAAELVNRAVKEDLVPECLSGKDLRENITRAEFAAMAVKLYEAMSLEKAELPDYNPFKDTDDPEVLKAFELGIVSGMTANTFCGDELVTREQAATMLTSVYKVQRVRSKGAYYLMWLTGQYWGDTTPENNKDNYGLQPDQTSSMLGNVYNRLYGALDTSKATLFFDHKDISEWAQESVYFMEMHGVIKGVGNHMFAPKANAQAQAALVMAIQMLEKV